MGAKRKGLYEGHGPEAVARFRERVERAHALRRLCVACHRQGVEPATRGSSVTAGKCADSPLLGRDGRPIVDDFGSLVYTSCPGRGHLNREIAERLGVSISAAATYLTDPNRERERERRAKYKGTCAECAGPTDSKQVPKCGWCLKGERSPHLVASSPTGFRDHTPRTCGSKGCTEPRDGSKRNGLMCSTHADLFARLAAEFEAETAAPDDWTDRAFGGPHWGDTAPVNEDLALAA